MVEALTTRDFLDRVESQWVERIKASSIAAEVIAEPDFDPQHVANALIGLGRVARKFSEPHELAQWPACVVVAVSYKALEDYEQGAFWDRFSTAFTERRISWTSHDNSLWGEAFLLSLRRLGLPTFETTRKYVGNFVMHAGVPMYCYRDFLQVLARAISEIGHDGPEAVAWLRARVGTATFTNIDAPVRDFIESGDIFAADFIARNVELLDRLQHGEDPVGVGLSTQYVERAEEYISDVGAPRAAKAMSNVQMRPTLRLETSTERLLLGLPPVVDGQGMHWTISADGDLHDITPPTAWASHQGASAVDWDVPAPAQKLAVASTDDPTVTFAIDLISDRSPYLLFQEDGAHISPDSPVPAEPVWILRLDDTHPIDADGEIVTIARGAFPLGWGDWRLELIDLSRTSSFTVKGALPRRVNNKSRARIVCDDQVADATSGGLAVFASRPTITLPADVPEAAWTVSVKDLRDGSYLPSPSDLKRPLGALDGPLVGAFEIAVRGPLGRGGRRLVCVVEDLVVRTEPAFRSLTENGVDPCKVWATAPAGVSLSDTSILLGPDDLIATVEVVCHGREAAVSITPPSMAISLDAPGLPTQWSHRPLSLRIDTFAESRILLRLPPSAKGLVGLRVNSSGVNHQIVDSARVGDVTTAVYPLDKAADTVAQLGAGQLSVLIPGREVLIGTFRPSALAQSAAIAGDRVALTGLVTTDVEVIAWALYAPWLGPTLCTLEGSAWTIPPALAGQGPLVFNLRVLDPWKSSPTPSNPERSDLFLVDAPTDTRADALTQFLTGFETAGTGDFDAAKVLSQLSFSSPYAAPAPCRLSPWQVDELRAASSATDKLEALTQLEVTRPRRPHLVVISGCATEPMPPAMPAQDKMLSTHLSFHPLEGALRNLDLLGDVDSPDRFPELWRQSTELLGTDLMHVICGSPDPSRSKPRFDANAAMLLTAPQAIRDQIITASKYLPRSVTDVDSRTIATWQLFSTLEDPRISQITTDSLTILAEASHLLRKHHFIREADAVRSREDPSAEKKWMALPAVSLALAISARLGARGNRELLLFAKSRERQWQGFTAVARKLSEIDLVLAEAYSVSATRSVHPPSDAISSAATLESTND